MEQLKNENVSVKSDSLNRGCIVIGDSFTEVVENLDDFELHSQDVERHVFQSNWKPVQFLEEAVAIVKAHPITSDMTYEERLAALKARFGL